MMAKNCGSSIHNLNVPKTLSMLLATIFNQHKEFQSYQRLCPSSWDKDELETLLLNILKCINPLNLLMDNSNIKLYNFIKQYKCFAVLYVQTITTQLFERPKYRHTNIRHREDKIQRKEEAKYPVIRWLMWWQRFVEPSEVSQKTTIIKPTCYRNRYACHHHFHHPSSQYNQWLQITKFL